VVVNHHQAALRIVAIDAAGGVGNDHRLDTHAGEHADWERDFFRGIAFVEVDAALHRGDGMSPTLPMTRRPAWPMAVDWENSGFSRRDFRCVAKFVGEIAKSRAQDQSNARPQVWSSRGYIWQRGRLAGIRRWAWLEVAWIWASCLSLA